VWWTLSRWILKTPIVLTGEVFARCAVNNHSNITGCYRCRGRSLMMVTQRRPQSLPLHRCPTTTPQMRSSPRLRRVVAACAQSVAIHYHRVLSTCWPTGLQVKRSRGRPKDLSPSGTWRWDRRLLRQDHIESCRLVWITIQMANKPTNRTRTLRPWPPLCLALQ